MQRKQCLIIGWLFVFTAYSGTDEAKITSLIQQLELEHNDEAL